MRRNRRCSGDQLREMHRSFDLSASAAPCVFTTISQVEYGATFDRAAGLVIAVARHRAHGPPLPIPLNSRATQTRKLRRNSMDRRSLLIALGALTAFSIPAQAQTSPQSWPQRSVRFIVPLGPGSGVDITARVIADRLSAKWGKPIVVENKPGGDAILAISAFTQANDDHVLLMAPTSTFTAHPFLHEKLPYEMKELVPIARVSNTVIAIGVPASLGINSMDELLKRAKADPGKLNMASATGANDFVTAGFLKQGNVDIARVPYRDTVQAINDLAEGRIQLYVAAYAIMRPQVQAGKVKVLALMNNAREAGTPGLSMDGLVGLFGPKEMPQEVRDRIAADVIAAASEPELSTKIGA